MALFEELGNKIETFFRQIDYPTWGIIIFSVLIGALLCFLFSIKGSKKDKLIKNYFLFYLAILLVIVGVVITIYVQRFI